MIGTKNISGDIGVYKFQMTFGVASFTSNNTRLLIPYTGTADTALTANLTTYEYSLDGITWTAMTASSSTVVSSLSFTPTGASLSFEWMIKTDLGQSIYNKDIMVRLRATSGDITTSIITTTYNFSKIVSRAAQDIEYLPIDYSGIDGEELIKEKAPKSI
jgi:hypothetical protein